jgi:signal transduction histidine kinase
MNHPFFAMEPVAVRELAAIVIRQGRYDAEASVSMNIPADAAIISNGPYVHAIRDPLIPNAVNYSKPPRTIILSSDETDKDLQISVSDNGVGIAPDKLGVIFDPFYISDVDKLSRKYGRLGVGLTMARTRASRPGGTLTVKSTPGSGSTFTPTLPKGGRS